MAPSPSAVSATDGLLVPRTLLCPASPKLEAAACIHLSPHGWSPLGLLSPPQGFEMGTLAGPAFARLRHFLGLNEEDYQATLGPGGPYLQFLSTSKSKASFFLS